MENKKSTNDIFNVLIYIYTQTEFYDRNLDISLIVKETQLDKDVVKNALKVLTDFNFIEKFDNNDVSKIEKNYKPEVCYVVSDEMFKFTERLYRAKQEFTETLNQEKRQDLKSIVEEVLKINQESNLSALEKSLISQIYDATVIQKDKIRFYTLLKLNDSPKEEVKDNLHKLSSKGLIYSKWVQSFDDVLPDCSYCYFIAEDKKDFCREIYEKEQKLQENVQESVLKPLNFDTKQQKNENVFSL